MINLPFIVSKEKFLETIDELKNSEFITEEQLKYIEAKIKTQDQWVKCFIKTKFAGGISTTSRVEGLHAVQKKYLTSSSSLKKVLYSFISIEKKHTKSFSNEFNQRFGTQTLKNIIALKDIQEQCSEYVYKKILAKFTIAIDYKKESTSSPNKW